VLVNKFIPIWCKVQSNTSTSFVEYIRGNQFLGFRLALYLSLYYVVSAWLDCGAGIEVRNIKLNAVYADKIPGKLRSYDYNDCMFNYTILILLFILAHLNQRTRIYNAFMLHRGQLLSALAKDHKTTDIYFYYIQIIFPPIHPNYAYTGTLSMKACTMHPSDFW